jgi:hypothetical protein
MMPWKERWMRSTLISEHQTGIPLWMDALSGDSTDKESFRQALNAHLEQLHDGVGLSLIIVLISGKRDGGAECRLIASKIRRISLMAKLAILQAQLNGP